MAIIQSPWLGRSRKKLGGAVTYTAGGKVIARSMPASVSNPRSKGQRLTRVLMSTASKFYAVAQGFLDHSFEGVAEGSKCQQRFNKLAVELLRQKYNATVGTGTDFGNINGKDDITALVNPFVMSQGTLPNVVFDCAEATIGQKVRGVFNIPSVALVADGGATDSKYSDILADFGLPQGSQISVMAFFCEKGKETEIAVVKHARIILDPASGNVSTVFDDGGDINDPNPKNEFSGWMIEAVDGHLAIETADLDKNTYKFMGGVVIASVLEDGKWKRSTQRCQVLNAYVNTYLMGDALASWLSQQNVENPLYLNQGVAE